MLVMRDSHSIVKRSEKGGKCSFEIGPIVPVNEVIARHKSLLLLGLLIEGDSVGAAGIFLRRKGTIDERT